MLGSKEEAHLCARSRESQSGRVSVSVSVGSGFGLACAFRGSGPGAEPGLGFWLGLGLGLGALAPERSRTDRIQREEMAIETSPCSDGDMIDMSLLRSWSG